MGIKDIEWLFSPAGHTSAQKIFTNRVTEYKAFDLSIKSMLEIASLCSTQELDPQDILVPRKNVLHFYGIGGIGKTELLSRLNEHATKNKKATQHWPTFEHSNQTIIVHSDFACHSGTTIETLLITVRMALAENQIKCPAFDLLISKFWATNHPNESIESYLTKKSMTHDINSKTGIKEQFEESLGEIASSLLNIGIGISGSTLVRLIKTSTEAIAKHGTNKTILNDCKKIQDLISAPATFEILPYYCTCLAWDLSRAKLKEKTPLLIIFIDHFEDIDFAIERMLQQVVWLLPNVLFVISGRNYLRWAEDSTLDYFRKGYKNWPYLTTHAEQEPRQHRIGALSNEDSLDFLKKATAHYALEQHHLKRLSEVSSGFPFHLDLIIQHLATISQNNDFEFEDLLVPFPELAERVFRDLDHHEKKGLLASTLLDFFDLKSITAIAGIDRSSAIRLLNKPLFQMYERSSLPYSLDKTVRRTFLSIAEEYSEESSLADWTGIANRALDYFKTQSQGSSNQHKRYWLAQSLQVSNKFKLSPIWIETLSFECAQASEWDPTWKVKNLGQNINATQHWTHDFSLGLQVIFSRQSQPRNLVAKELVNIIKKNKRDKRFDLFKYFAAEALRDTGNLSKSYYFLKELSHLESPLRYKAIHAMIHLLRRKGDFVKAFELLHSFQDRISSYNRLKGEILWTQALFNQSARELKTAVSSASKKKQIGEMWLSAMYLCFVLSWTNPELTISYLKYYEDHRPPFLTSFSDGLEELAKLLSCNEDADTLINGWQANHAFFVKNRQTSLVAYNDLAILFKACIINDQNLIRDSFSSLSKSSSEANINYLVNIAYSFIGERNFSSNINWLDANVLKRWHNALLTRKQNNR